MSDDKPHGSGGRASTYTDELADTICERLMDGESLRTICAGEGMPNKSTVLRWLEKDPAFATRYARAREVQADTLVDDILSIADDGSNDWMAANMKDGEATGWRENGEAIRRSQLRVEARKWMAMKLRPKRYGEKLQVGGDPEGVPVALEMDALDVARRVAFLLASGEQLRKAAIEKQSGGTD